MTAADHHPTTPATSVDAGILVEPDTVASDGIVVEDDPPADVSDSPILDELGERLGSFYALRKSDSAEADALLDQLGASGTVDREILVELAAPKPLYLPDKFLAAHTLVVRSLEVLDRNGTRKPPIPARLGPLRPVAAYLVGIVTGFIVRSHLKSLVDNLHRLYIRREANSMPDDPGRALLRRGRMDLERLAPGFRRNPLGVPTFLLGGAFLSTILGALQDTFGVFGSSSAFRVIATLLSFAVAGSMAWVILRGAAVAHRRIDLTTDKPMAALYETIGRAGKPPKDQSGTFAIVSIAVTILGLLVIPAGLALTVFA